MHVYRTNHMKNNTDSLIMQLYDVQINVLGQFFQGGGGAQRSDSYLSFPF